MDCYLEALGVVLKLELRRGRNALSHQECTLKDVLMASHHVGERRFGAFEEEGWHIFEQTRGHLIEESQSPFVRLYPSREEAERQEGKACRGEVHGWVF